MTAVVRHDSSSSRASSPGYARSPGRASSASSVAEACNARLKERIGLWYVRSAGGRANPRLGSRRNRAARRRGRARRLRVPLRARHREPTRRRVGAGNWRTTNFGSAFDDPEHASSRTSSTRSRFAGWLFIVASGFSLIFGLMRVVNMAHGAFYLLGGYIAYEIQQRMTRRRASRCRRARSTPGSGSSRSLVACRASPSSGSSSQQAFLRWNQGQELRQALITIAISVIIADQIIAHFPRTVAPGRSGSAATPSTSPGRAGRTASSTSTSAACSTRSRGSSCSRSVSPSASALWLWLYRTQTGHGHPRGRRRPSR